MTKTVKELVDDYKARNSKNVYDHLIFEIENSNINHFKNCTNIIRDNVKLSDLKLDTSFHTYQLDHVIHESVIFGRGTYWEQETFTGKLVRFTKIIEE